MAPTLLLDLDGTLVDTVPDLRASLNRRMTPAGLAPFTAPEVADMVGDGVAALVGRAMAARGLAAQPGDVAAFMADYTAHAADESHAYAGVPETLPLLRDAGWRLAVCTNKPARPARLLLEALGLLHLFTAVGAGDSFAVRKPDPAHLLATIAAAGGEVDDSVMVGDHHNDVRAARDAGLACVFAAWGYGKRAIGLEADAVAERFADLPGVLTGLRAGGSRRGTSSHRRTSGYGS